MMRKPNKNILLGILVFISLFFILTYRWNERNEAKLTMQLEVAMDNYLEGKTSIIDVASINYLKWDRVYIFDVYDTCENIAITLGAPLYWFRCQTTGIEYNEGISLFVFMRNGNVVGNAIPSIFTLGKDVIRKEFSIEDAYFTLDENGILQISEDH